MFHDTAEEAKAAAMASIEYYRDATNFDGEWSPEVEEVKWGQVLGVSKAIQVSTDPESYDYGLIDVKGETK